MPAGQKRKRARTKWTAPIVGHPVRNKDGNIVEREGMPELTEEQERNVIENTEHFRTHPNNVKRELRLNGDEVATRKKHERDNNDGNADPTGPTGQ